jgi:epoxide hydrolase-like predicted phosphatase
MSVRVIVFDFGNVIGFFDRRRAAQQLAAHGPPGVLLDDLMRFIFFTDLEPAFESGRVTGSHLLEQLRKEFGLVGTDEQLGVAHADMFTPNKAVCDLIPRLAGRYKLALLSNTNELHYRQFRGQFADVLDRFDRLFVSHEMGLRKPDPSIYRHVSDWANVPPSECLFIDDLPENVAAARACGWQAIVYRPENDLVAELRSLGVEAV